MRKRYGYNDASEFASNVIISTIEDNIFNQLDELDFLDAELFGQVEREISKKLKRIEKIVNNKRFNIYHRL